MISIITPVYNGQHTLARAVQSVLAQTWIDWEMLIVSDDGCNYQQLLAEQGIVDARLHFFDSDYPASGPNRTRNIALQAAHGEFIAPLDADDCYYPERLARLLPLAQEFGIAGDNAQVVVDGSGLEDAEVLGLVLPPYDGVRWLTIADYCMTTTPLIFLFRRDVIKQGWNGAVILGEDTLFNLRGLAATGGAAFIGEPLHAYRVQSGSICHSADATVRADAAYQFCLNEINHGGMGLSDPLVQPHVVNMLTRKRQINQAYDYALRHGFNGSYQHYAFAHHRITTTLPASTSLAQI